MDRAGNYYFFFEKMPFTQDEVTASAFEKYLGPMVREHNASMASALRIFPLVIGRRRPSFGLL